MSSGTLTLQAQDEAAMVTLGHQLAAALAPGLVIFLNGMLGAGKTTLARGLIQALGHTGAVKSPTYTLVEPYELEPWQVYHFDLYRLGDPQELEFMGIRDYFGEKSVSIVEWPERGFGVLPQPDIVITITVEGSRRDLLLRPDSALGKQVLHRLSLATLVS